MDASFLQLRREAEGGLVESAIRAINHRIRRDRPRKGDPNPSQARPAAPLGLSPPRVRQALPASGTRLSARIVGASRVVARQTWRIGWESRSTDAERLANVECHARIAAAIDAREPRVAEAAMAEHFDNSVRALLSAGVI